MTQTTTYFNAVDCIIKVDNSTGTLTDVSGSSNKVELEAAHEVGELTTFGGLWKIRDVAFKSMDGTIDIVASTAASEAMDIFLEWWFTSNGAKRTVQFDFPDSSAGSRRISGEFVLVNLPLSFDSGDANPVMFSCEIQSTGEITMTTITS